MCAWTVKKLSTLVKVSRRTLHYYDEIDLLKPSSRTPSGYRIYGEQDVTKLKKILFFKQCGFTLEEVRVLLSCSSEEALRLFAKQIHALKEHLLHIEETQLNVIKLVHKKLRKVPQTTQWHAIIQPLDSYIQKLPLEKDLPKNRFGVSEDSF